MSESLGVQEARRRLPELLSRAEAGEQLVINRHGQPVAALVPLYQRQVPQRRRLLELRGSGRGYWPDSAAAPPASGSPFDPHQLAHGALIGFEASALLAFLSGAADKGGLLTQLLEGIGRGFWRGQISSLCLMRLLEGPLSRGHEGRAQSYRQVFADGQAWQVVAVDGAVAEAAARLRRPQPWATQPPGTQPSGGHLSAGAALELAAAIQAGAAVLVSDDAELLHGRALLPALDLPVVPSV
ncbi:MAG: type II toxin-antitoxin system prevent-host-death family antitoxin [Cyanobium sp. Prado107]|jgi:prevent-host-death family protein|nr:type II toxin-antitoxin system prevent-host-death family antitoxin [Cyanobium sp. Prado107]